MVQRLLEFLLSLNRVSLGGHTRLEFGVEWRSWIFPILLLLAALGYWSYRRQSASPRKKIALGIVRAVLLITVFLLFCRPQLVVDHEDRQPSVVAIWLDSSASMTMEDPYRNEAMKEFVKGIATATTLPANQTRLNRYQLAAAALQRAQWLRDLAKTQHIVLFTGAEHAQRLGEALTPDALPALLAQLKSTTPEGKATDIPTVLREMMESVQGSRVSSVILLTDGQTTEEKIGPEQLDTALALAQQGSTKIFALPLGETEEPFDLKLADLQLDENSFAGDPVALRAHLSGTGITASTPVKVTVYRKEPNGTLEPLTDKDYTLDPTKKETDIEIIFKPLKKKDVKSEKFDLIAKVEPVGINTPEELWAKNNLVTGQTNVVDAQINVLYVEGYPRWEFRYLKNELIREKTVNVSTLLNSADQDFHQDADPPMVDKDGHETFPGPITGFPDSAEQLSKYDVLLIGDVEPTFFSPTQQKLIVSFVAKGGGIGWLAGNGFNPESYKDTPLDVLLPVIPDELDSRARVMAPAENAPFNMILTPAGRASNLFKFFDDTDANVKQMADLPEMYWYKPVVGLPPATEVLAVHPTRSQGGSPAPLIVTGHYLRGTTMFSAVADTWRWRRYTGEPLYQSYWLQMCRLLYRNKGLGQDRRIELTTDSSRSEIDKPVKITLDIHDPTLLTQLPAEVPVTLLGADGRAIETTTLTHDPQSPEKMTGTITVHQMGDITLAVAAGALPVDVPPIQMSVEPSQREFEKITADVDSLKLLAAKTTGQVVPLSKSEDLAKDIPDRSLSVIQSEAEELWYKPFALILVVGLATAEWLLRKSAGLV